MNRVRQPFNTNLPAQAAALAALMDNQHFVRSRRVNHDGKAYLYRQFENLNITFTASQTNFIYFRAPGDRPEFGAKIHQALLEQGIIIRHFADGALRVTIGLQKENRRFIGALKKVCSLLNRRDARLVDER
jgi:histidinol-phosphate aminotransferase